MQIWCGFAELATASSPLRHRIFSRLQRQGDTLTAEAVGFEDGADHFDGGAAGAGVAQLTTSNNGNTPARILVMTGLLGR